MDCGGDDSGGKVMVIRLNENSRDGIDIDGGLWWQIWLAFTMLMDCGGGGELRQ